MEIVLHFSPLFTCREPVWLPAKRVSAHRHVPKCSSTHFQANSLPHPPPFQLYAVMPVKNERKGYFWKQDVISRGQGVLSWWGLAAFPILKHCFLKPDVYKAILKQVLEIAPQTSYRQRNAVREWAVSSYTFLVSTYARVLPLKVSQARGRMIERGCLKQNKQTKNYCICHVFGHCFFI